MARRRLVQVHRLLDAASERPCLSCGHPISHARNEYEDTHSRCDYKKSRRTAGYDCGHQRFSKRCAEESARVGACYVYFDSCECSEEDRVIADLYTRMSDLVGSFSKIGSNR